VGRISSRYNYRVAKNAKTESQNKPRKLIKPDDIVIRNRKTEEKKLVAKKKVEKKQVPAARKKIIRQNNIVASKGRKGIKQTVVLEDLKNYCRGKSIILVGNSKEIINQNYGEKIDSYDIVVRMNHGHPISKYVKQMGKKYNIWAHGFLSFQKQIKEYQGIKNRIDYHIETNEDKLCRRIFDNKAFLIPKRWYKVDYENNHKGKEMSTGLNTATFFIQKICTMREISIVGFDFLRTSNRILQSASARKFHDSNAEEADMTSMLLESGIYVPFNDKYNFAK